MKIVCPKCQFEREIDLASIPSTATTATCPVCEEKFAFREALPDYSREKPKGIIVDSINTESLQQATLNDTKENTEEKEVSTEIENISNTEEKQEQVQQSQVHLEKTQKPDTKEKAFEDLTEEEQIQYAHATYRKQAENLGNSQAYIMVPWEMLGNSPNIFAKFFQTVLRVLFSSPAFFATMYRPLPISKAVIFYIVIGLLQFVSRMMMLRFSIPLETQIDPQVQSIIEFMQEPSTLVLGLFVAPFVLIMQLIIVSIILHIVIKLLEPRKADFSLVVRMFAYASAPGLLSIIPVLGDTIATPWVVFNMVIACRFGLNMTIPKALLTIVAFFVFITLVLLMIFPTNIFQML